MPDRYKLIRLIADGRFHSGQTLATHLGISRAAVWKQLRQLRDELGLELHAVSGKGYRLAKPIQLLDNERIRQELSDEARERLVIETHFSLPSTNRYCLEQARVDPKQNRLVIAERQTEGRGRRGRDWVSPFGGNIYFSLYWWFDLMPAAISALSLSVGVVLARSLRQAGVPDCRLKWPNDILVKDKKLAGILLEMQGESGGGCGVVVGIGINVDMSGATAMAIEQPWTDLQALTSQPIDRNRLIAQLASSLRSMLRSYPDTGLQPYLGDWQQLDAAYGRQVAIHRPTEILYGIARGVDNDGALLVERDGQIQRFYSGEISLRMTDDATGKPLE